MKRQKNIFLTIGIVLILANLVGYLDDDGPFPRGRDGESEFNLGYFLGFNFLAILGLVFIRYAMKAHKKIKRKEEQDQLDNLLKEDQHSTEKP